MKILAFVEVDDAALAADAIEPSAVQSVAHIKAVDPATFAQHWNAGIEARNYWEKFCENFFQLIYKSGLIDENGLHVDEYTPGSICRFILANKEMISPEFRKSYMGMIIMQAVNGGAKTLGAGKDIDVNWAAINAHSGPMTDAVLHMIVKSPYRKEILQPLLDKYFAPPAIIQEAPTQN